MIKVTRRLMSTRTYEEMIQFRTLEERFNYLQLSGDVGTSTFGFDRYLNQRFYTSTEWKRVRNQVIARDNGCDLGVEGFEIHSKILIHHMNPISLEDLTHHNDDILDPEYLICTVLSTHNAIHYGDASLLVQPLVERRPGDTKLWGNRSY